MCHMPLENGDEEARNGGSGLWVGNGVGGGGLW